MEVYDQFRYGVALFLVGFAPASVLLRLVVHPLATFWRRVGYRWGYAAGFAVAALVVAVSLRLRGWIAHTESSDSLSAAHRPGRPPKDDRRRREAPSQEALTGSPPF